MARWPGAAGGLGRRVQQVNVMQQVGGLARLAILVTVYASATGARPAAAD